MSLGIFALATPSEARKLAKQISKGDVPETVSLAGMSLIDLVTLSQSIDPSSDGVGLLDEAIRVGHGAAVPIPPHMLLRLSQLTTESTPDIASEWSRAEEFRGMMLAEELETFLNALAELARKGASEKLPLLFINL